MKAVRFHQVGGPEVLRFEEAEQPQAGAGQVLVRVAGSAFNPADAGIRGGTLPFPVTLPHVPGYDVSGIVEALGEGVDNVAVGDAVIGFLPMAETGSAAEFVVAPAEALVAAPTTIDLEDAAALPSVSLTAWQALFDLGRLESGQRVLISGAGGSVGHFAIQFAKRIGAEVIATASPRSRDAVSAAGADTVIDHTATSVPEAVTDQVDLLVNLAPISPDDFAALVPLVRDGGAIVSTTAWMPTPGDESRGVRGETLFVRSDAGQLAGIVAIVDAGEASVDVAQRVALSELPSIHALAAAGELHGKVVALPQAR